MKIRYFFIILLAVMMVFAFSSCKEDPKPEVDPADPVQVIEDETGLEKFPWGDDYEPTDKDIYEITVSEGIEKGLYSGDKLILKFANEINEGDIITIKYRSERPIWQFDIRDGSTTKWVYETSTNGLVEPVLGDGGWYTLTYTFGNDINGNAVTYPYPGGFDVRFRGYFVEGDIFEVMEATLTHAEEVIPLEINENTIASSYADCELAEETIKDHVWDKPRTYAVLVADKEVGSDSEGKCEAPLVFKVEAGETSEAIFAELEKQGITKVYSDLAYTERFYKSWKVLEDAFVLYYENN